MSKPSTIKFYVINLDRSRDRFAHISWQMKSLNIEFTRITAIDGMNLSDEEVRAYPYRYYRPLTKGELGCSLSHYKCWQRIQQDQVDYGVIFEDDVILDEHLLEFLQKLRQETEPNWDILKLCQSAKATLTSFYDQEYAELRIRELRRKSAIIVQKMGRFRLIRFHPPAIGTYGQIVTATAAAHLVQHFTPSRPLDVDMKHLWDMHGLRVLSLYPPVLSMSPYASTLAAKKDERRHLLRKLFYQLNFSYKLFRYNCAQLGIAKTIALGLGKNIDLTG